MEAIRPKKTKSKKKVVTSTTLKEVKKEKSLLKDGGSDGTSSRQKKTKSVVIVNKTKKGRTRGVNNSTTSKKKKKSAEVVGEEEIDTTTSLNTSKVHVVKNKNSKKKTNVSVKEKTTKVSEDWTFDKSSLESALLYPDLPSEVSKIMRKQLDQEEKEWKVFEGIRWLDDALLISSKEKRTKKIKAMSKALSAAKTRERSLRVELNKWKKQVKTPEGKQVWSQMDLFQSAMTFHLPVWFRQEVNIEHRLENLVKISTMEKADKEKQIKKLMNPGEDILKHEKTVFVGAIEHGAGSGAAFVDPFFDTAIIPPTPMQMKSLIKANDDLLARATEMRDLGADMELIEKALSHIPYAFWPDKCIDSLQAWRKIERELTCERLREAQIKEEKSLESQIQTGATGIKNLAGMLRTLSKVAGDARSKLEGFNKNEVDIVNAILTCIQHLCTITKPLAKSHEEHGDPQVALAKLELKEKLGIAETLCKIAKTLVENIGKLEAIPGLSEAGKFLVEYAPFIGIVASGFSFLASLKETFDASYGLGMAVEDYKYIETAFYLGKSKDRALLHAIMNEKTASKIQLGKKSVQAFNKGISFGGEIVSQFGAEGQVAGKILKFSATGIGVGNTIVFKGIDFKRAKDAEKMLQMAKAGSRFARTEVFKKSGYYAKMHIAVLAKEGDAFAVDFILKRGLTEADLTKPMALKIIRDKLLDKAGQENEKKKPKSDGIVEYAKWVATKLQKLTKGDGPKGDFNAPSNIVLSKAQWTQTIKQAKQDALGSEKKSEEAVYKALKELEKDLEQSIIITSDVLKPGEKEKDKRKPSVVGKLHKATILSLDKLLSRLDEYIPVAKNGKPHDEMLKYVCLLRTSAVKQRAIFKADMEEVGAIDLKWKVNGALKKEWKEAWGSAKKACFLLPDGKAVTKAMNEYKKCSKSDKRKSKAPATRREALKAEIKSADALVRVLVEFREHPNCWEFGPTLDYLDKLIDRYMKELRDLNKKYYRPNWVKAPFKLNKKGEAIPVEKKSIDMDVEGITETFKQYYYDARDKGFIDKRTGNAVLTKLGSWEVKRAAKIIVYKNEKVHIYKNEKVRWAAAKKLKALSKACDAAILESQDNGHYLMIAYLAALRKQAEATPRRMKLVTWLKKVQMETPPRKEKKSERTNKKKMKEKATTGKRKVKVNQ